MKQTLATVRLGAKLLDKKFPGWAKKITPDILELNDPHRCVLGQLYGDFEKGAIQLGPPGSGVKGRDWLTDRGDDFAKDHGFDSSEGDEGPSYEALNCAWMLEIAKRLSPK